MAFDSKFCTIQVTIRLAALLQSILTCLTKPLFDNHCILPAPLPCSIHHTQPIIVLADILVLPPCETTVPPVHHLDGLLAPSRTSHPNYIGLEQPLALQPCETTALPVHRLDGLLVLEHTSDPNVIEPLHPLVPQPCETSLLPVHSLDELLDH